VEAGVSPAPAAQPPFLLQEARCARRAGETPAATGSYPARSLRRAIPAMISSAANSAMLRSAGASAA